MTLSQDHNFFFFIFPTEEDKQPVILKNQPSVFFEEKFDKWTAYHEKKGLRFKPHPSLIFRQRHLKMARMAVICWQERCPHEAFLYNLAPDLLHMTKDSTWQPRPGEHVSARTVILWNSIQNVRFCWKSMTFTDNMSAFTMFIFSMHRIKTLVQSEGDVWWGSGSRETKCH